jgi:hypothetical protein
MKHEKKKKIIEIFFFLRFGGGAEFLFLHLYWFVSVSSVRAFSAFLRMLFCFGVVFYSMWRLRDVGEGGAMVIKVLFYSAIKNARSSDPCWKMFS